MTALRSLALVLVLACGPGLADGWRPVADGIEYRQVLRDGVDAHAVRIDLDAPRLAVVASAASERGATVGEFARARGAIVAINGDYFTPEFDPIGLAMGDGVVWARAGAHARRQEVIGVGDGRVRIFPRARPLQEPKRWMTGAVSGWPMVVEDCVVLAELPGSPQFTLAPHPRSAVGLSGDRRLLLLVVADGRRDGVPGLTLPELGALMVELGACTALNLDGGGSTALWLRDRIVNQPSDGPERRVANHLGVIQGEDSR